MKSKEYHIAMCITVSRAMYDYITTLADTQMISKPEVARNIIGKDMYAYFNQMFRNEIDQSMYMGEDTVQKQEVSYPIPR